MEVRQLYYKDENGVEHPYCPVVGEESVFDSSGVSVGRKLQGKQDKLVAGNGITSGADGKTISASGVDADVVKEAVNDYLAEHPISVGKAENIETNDGSNVEVKLSEIDEVLNGTKDTITVTGNTFFNASGFSTHAKYASTNVLPAGDYLFPKLEEGCQYSITYYVSDSEGTSYFPFGNAERNLSVIQPFVVSYRRLSGTSPVNLTDADVLYFSENVPVDKNSSQTAAGGLKSDVRKNTEDIAEIKSKLDLHHEPVSFCPNVNSAFLLEMYFPSITDEWKLTGFTVNDDYFRLNLKKPDGSIVTFGYGNPDDGKGMGGFLSGKVIEWIDGSDIIGYFVFNVGDGMAVTSTSGYALNVSNIKAIDNSQRIKEYLSRRENILLIGDSIFGYKTENILSWALKEKTNKKIYNAGFSGCRASLRSGKTGDDNWNALSLVGVVDSIVNGDFSPLDTAVANLSTSYSYFKNRIANLKAVDFNMPTTIFINYGNNDMTGSNRIGSPWEAGADVSSFDKNTLLGAMNYSLSKLLEAYPHIKVIYLTPVWRMLGSSVAEDGGTSGSMVAPYDYKNENEETFAQFVDAIINNTSRLGVKCLDAFRMGGRTALNFEYYSVDTSHFNIRGYEMFANVLANAEKCL